MRDSWLKQGSVFKDTEIAARGRVIMSKARPETIQDNPKPGNPNHGSKPCMHRTDSCWAGCLLRGRGVVDLHASDANAALRCYRANV